MRKILDRGDRSGARHRSRPARRSAADKLKVGFIYVGPVGDFGWTYQHDLGRLAMVKELGDKVETTFLENVSEGPDAERAIEQLARAGNKLIFTTSFGFMDPTLKVAKKYPERACSSTPPATSATRTCRPIRAASTRAATSWARSPPRCRRPGVLGYIGSFPIPEVISGINAFMLGAQSVNPDFKVKIIWVNTWFDPGKEADAAKALLDQGADIIMQHTDSPGRDAGRRGARHAGVRPGLRHDQVRPEGAAHRRSSTTGALLRRARQGRARRHLEVGRRLGRPEEQDRRDGALHQHARRREEDGDGDRSRDHRRQAASVQVPDRRPGRQGSRMQGRRHISTTASCSA